MMIVIYDWMQKYFCDVVCFLLLLHVAAFLLQSLLQ